MKGFIPFLGIIVALALAGGAIWFTTQIVKDTTQLIGKLIVITVGGVVSLGSLYLFIRSKRISKGTIIATAIVVIIGVAVVVYGMTALQIIR